MFISKQINNDVINHIIFVSGTAGGLEINNSNQFKSKSEIFNLFDTYKSELMNEIPMNYTISTNNGIYKFNLEMLKDTSSVISKLFDKNPNNRHYHLDINDNSNIFKKIEQLYQNKLVYFDLKDLTFLQQITDLLDLKYCPNYFKANGQNNTFILENSNYLIYNSAISDGTRICELSLKYFFKNRLTQKITIKTNTKEYICNIYGAYSSKSIKQGSKFRTFYYNFNDIDGEFQLICDLFNFNDIKITIDNIDFLTEIANDLQIDPLINKIREINEGSNNFLKTIDNNSISIYLYDHLFELLYNIKKDNIELIKKYIIDSNWGENLEKVQELAAIFIHVIKNNIKLHQMLVNLLIQINQEQNFKSLIPFIIEKFMNSFGKSYYNSCFLYNLFKANVISKSELMKKLKKVFWIAHINLTLNVKNILFDNNLFQRHNNILIWFLNELIEMDFYHKDSDILKKLYPKSLSSLLNETIDDYLKKRDNIESDNQIIKALQNDDVQTLQSIISINNMNVSNCFVPYNMYDDITINENINYLNYSAAYGSIRCFKYLLLNHIGLDSLTLKFSVYGGNIEIIRICEHYFEMIEEEEIVNIISIPIIKHQNNLFDWCFEQKLNSLNDSCLSSIIKCSAENGNLHVLLEIISKGYISYLTMMFNECSKYGFYEISEKLLEIAKNYGFEVSIDENNECSVIFGNISILKLYSPLLTDKSKYINLILLAIKKRYMNVINYIIKLLEKNKYEICLVDIFKLLTQTAKANLPTVFHYFKNIDSGIWRFFKCKVSLNTILENACKSGNLEVFKTIFEFYDDFENDLSNMFYLASKYESFEICQFLIDNSYINFDKLLTIPLELSVLNEKVFQMIFKKCNVDQKQMFLSLSLYPAIENRNIKLVDYLLKEKAPYDDALLISVRNSDLKIVKIILKYHKDPIFINKKSDDGTVFSIAVKNNDLAMGELLLSIPGININFKECIYNPFIIAVTNLNIDFINQMLNYFLKNQTIQTGAFNFLQESLYILIDMNSKENNWKINKIFDLLLENKTTDININQIFKYACSKNNIEIIEKLLDYNEVDVNQAIESNGNSLLMIAIGQNNFSVAELLIKNKRTNINIHNHMNKTPLIVAVEMNQEQTIDLLLNDQKFDPKESRLDYAFYISKGEISKCLLCHKFLDVNYIEFSKEIFQDKLSKRLNQMPYRTYESTLMNAIILQNNEKVDMILSHLSFDKIRSKFCDSIIISLQINDKSFFHKLLQKIDEDEINNMVFDGTDLLNFIINTYDIDLINMVLNNFPSISKKKLIKAISRTFNLTNKSYEIMEAIINYDQFNNKLINFNELLSTGKSFFTSLKVEDNFKDFDNVKDFEKIINLFLINGIDPNIKDKDNILPLEYAILNNSLKFVQTLINSNKIDLSQKISKGTFLHLAASSSNPQILIEILNRNVININSTNNLDETPLFIACYNRRNRNIEILFENDDLDYLHLDYLGFDALGAMTMIKTTEKLDKNQYLKKLLDIYHKH